MQVDLVESESRIPLQPLDVPADVGRDSQLVPQVLWPGTGRFPVEIARGGQVLVLRQVDRRDRPVPVGRGKRLVLIRCEADRGLEHYRLSLPTSATECIHHLQQLARLLADGD